MTEASKLSSILEIVNERGLHARASAKVVELSEEYTCQATVRHDGEIADPRSIMDLLTLAAPLGSKIEVEAEGEDSAAYLSALEALVADKFGEGR